MKEYLIVSIQPTEDGQSYGNDIVKAEGKLGAIKKFIGMEENEGCLILNVVCLVE